jgi:nitrite reductase/ring-hydroxylating ferredoxin subunit
MTKLCHINEIEENTTKGFKQGEESYFAVKKSNQIYLYRNQCPHLGIELNWMDDKFLDLNGTMIQCFTHGALFVIEDGECIAGPCLGARLQAVEFEIIDDEIRLIK